jgi:hypothetical protein
MLIYLPDNDIINIGEKRNMQLIFLVKKQVMICLGIYSNKCYLFVLLVLAQLNHVFFQVIFFTKKIKEKVEC